MTAVEWLIQEIQSFGIDTKFLNGTIEQAKELEKILIVKAYEDKMHDLHKGLLRFGEKYYKDNYEN